MTISLHVSTCLANVPPQLPQSVAFPSLVLRVQRLVSDQRKDGLLVEKRSIFGGRMNLGPDPQLLVVVVVPFLQAIGGECGLIESTTKATAQRAPEMVVRYIM